MSVGAHTVCAVDASVAIHIALAVGCITLYIGSGSDKASWFLENNAVFVGYFHADADPLCGKSDPHRAHFRFDRDVVGFCDFKALLPNQLREFIERGVEGNAVKLHIRVCDIDVRNVLFFISVIGVGCDRVQYIMFRIDLLTMFIPGRNISGAIILIAAKQAILFVEFRNVNLIHIFSSPEFQIGI